MIASQLYKVSLFDAPALVSACAVLLAVALAALWLPARRGKRRSHVHPAIGAIPSKFGLSETAARALFGDEDSIGQKVILGVTDRTAEVIAVVADTHAESLGKSPQAEVHFSFLQRPRTTATVVLRSNNPGAILAPTVCGILQELDVNVPLVRSRDMAKVYHQSLAGRRLSLALLCMFAGAALVLSAPGIYSVGAYNVQQRTDVIGIRLALGATPGEMHRMIVGQNMRLTLVGLGTGLLASYFLTKILLRLLFDVAPSICQSISVWLRFWASSRSPRVGSRPGGPRGSIPFWPCGQASRP